MQCLPFCTVNQYHEFNLKNIYLQTKNMFSQYKVFSSKSVTETNEIFKFKMYIHSLLLKNIQKILSKNKNLRI